MNELEEKWRNCWGNINIEADIELSDIPKIIAEERIHSLQLYHLETPSEQTWQTLNAFYEQYPNIGLRIVWRAPQDFSFYEKIPNVRNFTISSYNTKDFSKLAENTKLTRFAIEDTKSIAVDISFIKDFKDLEELYIDGMKKGVECVKELSKLKRLTFRGIKLPNIDCIANLNELKELNLRYGSYKDLSAISNLRQLKSLEISRVRQIPNYDFLKSLTSLERIEFEGMSQLEQIPDLSGLNSLKVIKIDNNSKLKDITAVLSAPKLEALLIWFPENFKANDRRSLLEQAASILMESKTIKYSNIMRWLDDKTAMQLEEKGIGKWHYQI